MAAPSKDPRTGIYQFRRAVPEALRPFFDGGVREFKRTLDTRDPVEAKERYPAFALIYEQKIAAARRALLHDHVRSAKGMVDAYLAGTSESNLRGVAMKLASLELDAFDHAHGGMGFLPGARYDFGTPPSAEDLRDHRARKQMLEAVDDFAPLPWLETLRRIGSLQSLAPIDPLIATIAYRAGIQATPGTPIHEAIGRAYLDRLCAACAVKVEPGRTRLIPPAVISGENLFTHKAKSSAPIITAVFKAWCEFKSREPKLVDEWKVAIDRFVALSGDLPVDQITASMVRDFRRTYAGLPSRPKKAIKELPLREQVEYAKEHELRTLAPETVNKALSGLRVTLEHAVEELEAVEENVARTVKSLPTDVIEDPRLPFEPEDMQKIYSASLPQKDGVATTTLYWALLLAPFTGCRLEELGKLRPGNIRRYDGIDYIAIEPDRRRVREQSGDNKRVKTASGKRDFPIHSMIARAGFLDLVAQRRSENASWIFPELQPNKYGSRTTRLSRVMNDFLDEIGLSDPELVFHSFRHTGKRAVRGKVDGEITDLLFGHADGRVSTKYGRGAEMAVLRDAIEVLSYPEVDWDKFIANAPR
ncbi:hypothetical protein DFR49_2951 [Hephaestia caeni]|uniref:DUF6538 domain-containing protein n=1 Tax=Hephaestia caeni TaxID=645617 RepID=A0A397NHR6_9SPHN|nr:site-specific integrase [Hephaestia caeni]RIA37076.1 hypothetical protein DFR49_2951 [Hephaestia caeni]